MKLHLNCTCGQECPVHPYPIIEEGPGQPETITAPWAWNRVVNMVLNAMHDIPEKDQDASLAIVIRMTKEEMALLREFVKGQ